MNKNSLRQLIVTEMILADVNGGGHAPPKKKSLLEMMDDSYLSELEDGRLAHSMESVVNLFEEVPKDNWTVADHKTGQRRAPKTSGPRSEKQQAAADAARAAWKATKDTAVAVQPPSTPTDDGQTSQNQDTEPDEDSNEQKSSNRDSDGNQDAQGSSDDSAPSGGLAYLDTQAHAEIDAALGVSDSDNTNESHLSLIDLLYDA